MGAGNVKRAYVFWRHRLPDMPFTVFVYMCLRSLDGADPPVYRAGWEELTVAMGRRIPDEDKRDTVATRERNAARRGATRVLEALTQLGAVKLYAPPSPGRPAKYALMLTDGSWDAERLTSDDDRETPNVSRSWDAQRSERETPNVSRSDPPTVPTDYSTLSRRTEVEEKTYVVPSLTTARETPAAATDERINGRRVKSPVAQQEIDKLKDKLARRRTVHNEDDAPVDNGAETVNDVARGTNELPW